MANQQHLDVFKQGVQIWNQWRQEYPDVQPDLSGANFSGANNFSGASFSELENLSGVSFTGSGPIGVAATLVLAVFKGLKLNALNLSGANLSKADFSKTNLIFADLSEANLSGAGLAFANLSNADLSKAQLFEVSLIGAKLLGTNLTKAQIIAAQLLAVDFSKANLTETNFDFSNLTNANLSESNLTRVSLVGVNLTNANLLGSDLTEANLSKAILVQTNLHRAILTRCRVYGISVWDIDVTEANQLNLIITDNSSNEPTITVDDLEVAQFIYLLLNRQKLRNVLNAVTKKGVLILGRFGGGGLEVLQTIAAKLREMEYLPMIFDFERPTDRNYTETVKTLAGLARFIIADLSGPSVPQELYATIPHFKIPFVPIIEAGRKQFAMVVDLLEYPWVIRPPVTFVSTEELLSLIPSRIIAPAEERHQARQQLLDELFNRK